MTLVRHQSSDLINVPDMMLVGKAIQGLTGFWIALIGQLHVAMDGLVAAPPKLVTDRGFASAGNAPRSGSFLYPCSTTVCS